MSKSLSDTLAAVPSATQTPHLVDGQPLAVELSLLDANPEQPRSEIDTGELRQLVDSIRNQRLHQPIVVQPRSDIPGRFYIVMGHRRTEAYRQLFEKTADAKYAKIPATVRLALDASQRAGFAFSENVVRSNLTLMEEARSVERLFETGAVKDVKAATELTSQNGERIRRLRQIARAPKFIQLAIERGVAIQSPDEQSKEAETPKHEKRHLDLMTALAVLRLFEHLSSSASAKPKKIEERIERLIFRVLSQRWSAVKTNEYVNAVVSGKIKESNVGDAPPAVAIFKHTETRFTIDLVALGAAEAPEFEAMMAKLTEVLEATVKPCNKVAHGE